MINDVSGGNYILTHSNDSLATVRSYTASSFYNWEQDNIPITDLTARTNTIAANVGIGLDISGATMVLSSLPDATNAIFSSIDDITARIPKLLDYPLLVEVCTYGNLGELHLEGITLKKGGSLAFINRNHAACVHGDITGSATTVATAGYTAGFSFGEAKLINTFKSPDLWTKISAATSIRHAGGCYIEGANGWNGNFRVFGSTHLSTKLPFNEPMFLTSGTADLINSVGAPYYTFAGTAYGAVKDVSVSADANPRQFGIPTQTSLRTKATWLAEANTGDLIPAMYAYGNYFEKVKIENCKGEQIQFKGICVDGATVPADGVGLVTHTTPIGFDIQNSDVVLTSCAAFRNREAGFKVSNSNISIEGGITGYRNYPLNSYGRTVNDSDIWDLDSLGNGFEASKSVIKFDETSLNTNASATSNLGKHGFTMMSNGGNGWIFDECKVMGGVGGHTSTQEQGAGEDDFQTTQLIAAFNKLNGFQIDSSQVKYQGIIRSQANEVDGIYSVGSKIGVMGAIADFNSENGLHLDSSQFTYNIGASKYFVGYDTSLSSWKNRAGHSAFTPAICTEGNGIHNINIINTSQFSDNRLENSGQRAGLVGGRKGGEDICQMWSNNALVRDAASMSDYETGNIPLINVTNNSYARLLGLAAIYDNVNSAGAYVAASGSVKGRVLSVTDNSNVDLYGSSAFNTNMTSMYSFSAELRDLQLSWNKCAVYAGNNSKIRISGPTKISKIGVNALAENSSRIEIGPALDKTGRPDKSLNPLDPSGHTRIELHSTRACLVVNNKSSLEIVKVGADVPANTINIVERQPISSYNNHSGAFLQFYPNGFTEEIWNTSGGYYSSLDLQEKLDPNSSHLRTVEGIAPITTPVRTNHNLASTGGMCVRAVGGSDVIVDQVNFEVHMPPADLSGAYYNIDGSGNEGEGVYSGFAAEQTGATGMGTADKHYAGSQIFIWNISDTSRILASNLKVNSVDSSAAGFHGPAGRWGSFSDWADNNIGALDYYGKTGAYGTLTDADITTAYNYGPFRLLTSVGSDLMTYTEGINKDNGSAHYTVPPDYSSSATGGSPTAQLNAQGYSCAGHTASSVIGSDFRSHSQIEQQTHNAGNTMYYYGQPVFGSRPGDDGKYLTSDEGLNSANRYLLSNPMAEDWWPTFLGANTFTSLSPQFPIPPIHMEWQGYLRNFLDESAAETFANAKHGASKMIKLCSIYRSNTDELTGGEGRDGVMDGDYTFGVGVRSVNMFDLEKNI